MRKVWVAGGVAVGLGLSFVLLLVVGVYLVAGNLVNGAGGGSVALAKGAVWKETPGLPPEGKGLYDQMVGLNVPAQVMLENGIWDIFPKCLKTPCSSRRLDWRSRSCFARSCACC